MKPFLLLACAWAISAAFASSQAEETVEVLKTANLEFAGAIAAYSLDSNIVEASGANGIVQLHGISPGTTTVVVVEATRTVSVTVTVPEPRRANGRKGGLLGGGQADSAESGSYEARYTSDPQQFTNVLDLRRDEGDSFRRLQLVNSNYFGSVSGASPVGFPLLSYEIENASRDIVFVDEAVRNSPLTVNGPFIRGFHFRGSKWEFHIGFTSVATFQDYFLATEPEYVGGITRRFKLSENSLLAANLYYFHNPLSETSISRNGAAGSLLYRYKPKRNLSLLSELGVSRGIGAASNLEYVNLKYRINATFRYSPPGYAALAIDNQHGVFGNVDLSSNLSTKLTFIAHFDEADFHLPIYRQNTLTASGNLTYKLTPHVSVNGGALVSDFKSTFPTVFDLKTVSGVTGADYFSRHVNLGFQYQPTVDSTGRLANGYSANSSTSIGSFQAGASYRHSVQIPTLASFFSAIPGLQDAVERSGVIISDPQQLQQFLTNTAFLQTLGFTGALNLNYAPAQNDLALNAEWNGKSASRQRIALSFLDSDTELVTGSFRFRTATLSYSRHVGFNNEFYASFAEFQTRVGPTTSLKPVIQVTFRHRFGSVPAAILGGRHGTIAGHVYRDDEGFRQYAPGTELGMAGVEVRLDDRTSARTDSEGYYEFRHVPYGIHTVQAKITDPRPYFFTTDSPAQTPIDSVVDIGVSFVRGKLFGHVKSDAGTGIPGVQVAVTGGSFSRTIQTAFDGKFVLDGVPDGEYSISTVPESYPDGYSLANLPAQTVMVKPDVPAPVVLVVRAFRTVSGRIVTLDAQTLGTRAVEGIVVTVPELHLTAKTDKNGRYLFRDLPAGSYTVKIERGGETYSQFVELPAAPTVISTLDFSIK
jgi:Carboxypeptidase regulatory-like domain